MTESAVNTLKGIELNCYHHQFYPYLEVKEVVWRGTVGQYIMFHVVLSDGDSDIHMDFHADTQKKFLSKIIGEKKHSFLEQKCTSHCTMWWLTQKYPPVESLW